jgi:2-hydroxy-6-oxonona-2,4-dienedioate hydrolase
VQTLPPLHLAGVPLSGDSMRAFFAVVLVMHGLAHLVGFLVPWRLVPGSSTSLPQPMNRLFGGRLVLNDVSARTLGVLWLVAGVTFAVVAIAWWRQQSWSGGALLAMVLASIVLTAVWWPAARIGLAINAGILLALAVSLYQTYRHDMALARSAAVTASVVANTSMGAIEYATAGDGEPVLSIHGTGGGWDQALAGAKGLVPLGYHVIAPSRFGYLRTPMPSDNSAAAEADAFAALLDHLDIERVSVISFSAGTAPALQFALRYPDRVNALILVVPAAGGIMPPVAAGPPPWVMNFVLRFDLPMWLAIHYMPQTTSRIVAVPRELVETLGAQDAAEYRRTVQMLLPISARREGLVMDGRNQTGGASGYPLEELSVPTLLVSAEDDLYETMRVARVAAERIPDAMLLSFATGGHLLVGRGPEMWPSVAEFIEQARTKRPWHEPRPVH